MRTRFIFTCLFVCLLFSPGQAGNNRCTITGKITDSGSGAALPLVNVGLMDLRRGAVTGRGGTYRIENVGQGLHFLRAAFIGYFATCDTFEVDSSDTVLERNYTLTPSHPMITTTRKVEAYQEHLRQLSLRAPVLRIRLDSLKYFDGGLFFYSTFSNDADTSIYIITEWRCSGFKYYVPVVFDSSHNVVHSGTLSVNRPGIIDLECDAASFKLFDRSDLVEIKSHASAKYRVVKYYGFNRLPPGQYNVGMKYEFGDPHKLTGYTGNPIDDAVVTTLRGSFVSDNTIGIENKLTDIVVLDTGK